MSIKIVFYGPLSTITREKTATIEASSLRDALTQLYARYGKDFTDRVCDEKGNPRRFINIYINGRDIRFLKNIDTKLKDGDTITLIPAVGGG